MNPERELHDTLRALLDYVDCMRKGATQKAKGGNYKRAGECQELATEFERFVFVRLFPDGSYEYASTPRKLIERQMAKKFEEMVV